MPVFAAALLMCFAMASAHSAVVLEDVNLVSRTSLHAQVAPTSRTLNITSAGRHRLEVADVSIGPPLTSVTVVILKQTQVIARATQFGAIDFDADAGAYEVYATAAGANLGTLSIRVRTASGAEVLNYAVSVNPNPAARTVANAAYEAELTVATSGTYTLEAIDRVFPVALASYDIAVIPASGGAPVAAVCLPACPLWPSSFTAVAGAQYDLFIRLEAAATEKQGLLSLKIRSVAAGSTLYAKTLTAGTLEPHGTVDFPAAGAYQWTLSDLGFPIALTQGRGLIVQDADVLTTASALSNAAINFNAQRGPAVIYAVGTAPSTPGVGAFGVRIASGQDALYGDARAVVASSAMGNRAYAFTAPLPSPGRYRIQARDFGFPTSIPALQFLVTQGGAVLGAFSVGGSLSVAARGGELLVIAVANTLSTAGLGLFGLSVQNEATLATALEVTQGVGDLFHTRQIDVLNAGNLDVTLADVAFPQTLDQLGAIVTRGETSVGSIYGGGKFTFAAPPGNYSVSFIAATKPTLNYGMYSILIEDSATLAPVFTRFDATPANIAQGATTQLEWTTQNATNCTASEGWSGARRTSDRFVTAPINADTTFKLTCTGPGGTSEASVKVTVVRNSNSGSGGGAVQIAMLFALAWFAFARRQRVAL